MVQTMKLNNELHKNIFSLHFKQKQKMSEEKEFHDKELEKLKNLVIEEEFSNLKNGSEDQKEESKEEEKVLTIEEALKKKMINKL
jgi:hypothetical protein